MLPLRYARLWLVAGSFGLLMVFVAALVPVFWSLDVGGGKGFDKWLHGGTFLFLALWFSGQYSRQSYWRIAAGLLMFGTAIEVAQRFTVHRTGDFYDLAANVAGIALGLLIAIAGLGGWSLRFERWFKPSGVD